MPALTIKNIPDDLYTELKTSADLHRRSINSEVLVCLEHVLFANKSDPFERLKRIEKMRASIKPNSISAKEILDSIDSGRP